ncbi:MAG: [FeFe] hydrogenase H-cluster radical SAM maturase HydG [Elusimicrobia bacterium GWA2_61_42]|nr:MAG: [FeFe] hydrogenase H-cluster radical SAM maturase HydG [Elusimicrobia bacterium GWA2_61_42]OGR77871.1 MAG: [FeFe] hydrogenase H-cluster radical SAM maturase HydG [Elusimicrobia bacterium GWC2_61_25]
MQTTTVNADSYAGHLKDGRDFIDDAALRRALAAPQPSAQRVRDILARSLAVSEALSPEDAAALIAVEDPGLLEEIFEAARAVKRKVYDNRIVTFAPLYASNFCVNNCLYCGFRTGNEGAVRRKLSMTEIKAEAEALAGKIGHKRIIFVTGEHPATGAQYIADAMREIYAVKVKTRRGFGQIRRVNVNAAPMSVPDLKLLKTAGIGTYQVFQETYDRELYAKLHPGTTPKADYRWRLYVMHRAFEAGIDDVALGALFGLGDWKFEVLGLVAHSRELEARFGIGPHTISFPRLETADGTDLPSRSLENVPDKDFKKLVAVLRLSVPYAGIIVTARERPETIREVIGMCTQRDASTRIGIGAYSERYGAQEAEKQQFLLGDTRTLDEVIGELADLGHITSFCTSGYRCGRTGDHIMKLLKSGHESRFCKLNAVLTFREWLDDFASDATRAKGEALIKKEIAEIRAREKDFPPETVKLLDAYYARIEKGERDLCF